MNSKHTFSLLAMTTLLAMTGCAETKNLGSSIGKGLGEITTGIIQGVQGGLTGKQSSTQTVDWTPYLKSMQAGCDYPYMRAEIPARFQPSLINMTRQGDPNNEGEEVIYTYHLQNAVAFGQPLDKISYLQGYEWSELTLYFKNNNFMSLRPQFKLPTLNEYSVVEKNNAEGYSIEGEGYMFLTFDKNKRSITCGSGV